MSDDLRDAFQLINKFKGVGLTAQIALLESLAERKTKDGLQSILQQNLVSSNLLERLLP